MLCQFCRAWKKENASFRRDARRVLIIDHEIVKNFDLEDCGVIKRFLLEIETKGNDKRII